ncbi:head decoration protein [Nocardiopsis sp. CNR-923]|uniref:head decoration protein n=1 Tax=Nocardiopsis sp. CNR-923 TaxID=1904965 RepID=UPI0021CC7F52|nr:head decoration protein [Nocardiopsis sp. CNR-923]
MDLTVRTEGFAQDDQSWLGSAHGTNMARSITLDTSMFTAGTHYPDGYFPSGLALGRITASGLYGPYDDGAIDGRETLSGFLFTATRAPHDGTATWSVRCSSTAA